MNIPAISLSSMQAASLRLANSSNNIANVSSTQSNMNGETVKKPYTPTDVVQSSQEPSGGVAVTLRERDPATLPVYAPDHPDANEEGIVQLPNVSLDTEVIQQKLATYTFSGGLKTLKAYDEMLGNLLDITA